jgi:mannose-6-phosphate isomerase-like protein (cupin superfamily)
MVDKGGSAMAEHPVVRAPDPAGEFYTAERCHILEIVSNESDEEASIARARVEPGITTAWHCVTGVRERYLIESGVGEVEVGDAPATVVHPGDVVSIPADVRQRITNVGDADLVFLCICTPRFQPELYVDLEAGEG